MLNPKTQKNYLLKIFIIGCTALLIGLIFTPLIWLKLLLIGVIIVLSIRLYFRIVKRSEQERLGAIYAHQVIDLVYQIVVVLDKEFTVLDVHYPNHLKENQKLIQVGDTIEISKHHPLPSEFRTLFKKGVFRNKSHFDYFLNGYFFELKVVQNFQGNIICLLNDSTKAKKEEEKLSKLNVDLENLLTINNSELALKREKFKTIFDKSSDAYFLLDEGLKISIYNEKVEQLFGRCDTVLFYKWIEKNSPSNQPKGGDSLSLFKSMKETCDLQEELRFEWLFKSKSNEDFPSEVSLTRLSISDHILYFMIIRNMVGQKKIESELRKNLEREKELNEMRSKFISMASHEFKTPLATILTNLDLMELTLNKENLLEVDRMNRFMDRMRSESTRLTILMDEVLQLGKIEAGKTPFKPIKVNTLLFISDYVSEFKRRSSTERQIDITFDLKEKEVWLDVNLMEHVLDNLLTNAIKYSEKEVGIFVSTSGEGLLIEVVDKGIGIPLSEFSQLFDSFFRGSNTNHIQGTGLGLVIAKEFVELHNGIIVCETEENKGTTFKVVIPF
ncbi:hypothetical protein EO216_14790 [Flammeovirga kamogawensis]|nr:hypothetical protein EO216_14790 [Flammeovirga kamogawensis]